MNESVVYRMESRRYRGSKELQGVTKGNKRLKAVTGGYNGLQGGTRG